jgi:hypothetical protein
MIKELEVIKQAEELKFKSMLPESRLPPGLKSLDVYRRIDKAVNDYNKNIDQLIKYVNKALVVSEKLDKQIL